MLISLQMLQIFQLDAGPWWSVVDEQSDTIEKAKEVFDA